MERGKESERRRIVKSFHVFNIRPEHRMLILEALDDTESWDWYRDCDGCTAVSEAHWPTKYFPPCLRHDYDWITGNGGLAGSRTFNALQRAYGMSRWRSTLRSSAVTLFWYAWAKWMQR